MCPILGSKREKKMKNLIICLLFVLLTSCGYNKLNNKIDRLQKQVDFQQRILVKSNSIPDKKKEDLMKRWSRFNRYSNNDFELEDLRFEIETLKQELNKNKCEDR